MAKSRFEYVKQFELDDALLPACWIVVRLDGKGFTKFSERHRFRKPNDVRSLDLMNNAAKEVMNLFSDIRLAFGESDEYSFVLHKGTTLYGRRSAKLISVIVSAFTASFVQSWSTFFPDQPLQTLPIFDARTVCYPTDAVLRDYLSWRQADTHINNQYNTCFWTLIQQDGKTAAEAQKLLKGTTTGDKNEILWQHNVNYQTLPEQFKKGTVITRHRQAQVVKERANGTPVERQVSVVVLQHVDIIADSFWDMHPDILK
ncbi:hypothetical protein ABBQ38_007227 [Trebouxia sp. C0009 RCD-2024]